MARASLRSKTPSSLDSATAFWQPFPWVLFKLGALILGSVAVWRLHPTLSALLKTAYDFFGLEAIYKFSSPTRDQYTLVSQVVLGVVLAVYGLPFLRHQIAALFSVAVLDAEMGVLYYSESYLVYRRLHVFQAQDLRHMSLRQTLIHRLLGLGTIVLWRGPTAWVQIRSIGGSSRLLKAVQSMRARAPDIPDA